MVNLIFQSEELFSVNKMTIHGAEIGGLSADDGGTDGVKCKLHYTSVF